MRCGARPERLLAILAVLAIAAVVVAVVALVSDRPGADRVGGTPHQAAFARAEVVRIVDGDTIVVVIDGREERVRYVGVDAPELANRDTGAVAECGADRATDANRDLVGDVEVELERDTSERDRFGRLLRHVWTTIDGERLLIGEQLVADGAIEARSYPPDTRYDGRLDAAEREARSAALGIWGSC